MPDLLRWLGLGALVVVLDQWSKSAVSSHFAYGESMAITPFFNMVLAHNQVAAFSMLNDAGGWQRWLFSAIAVVAAAWIAVLLHKHRQQKLFCFALALILGGALGNLIDRIAYGAVADFYSLHAFGYDWYIFNLADCAVVAGVIGLLYDSLLGNHKKVSNPSKM